MSEIIITITGDEVDRAAARILIAQAFIDIGAINIVSPTLSPQALDILTHRVTPDVIARCSNSCKITII